MSDLSGCPHCEYVSPDGVWFTFVDLSLCRDIEEGGARYEIRVSCNKCHGHIDIPGE